MSTTKSIINPLDVYGPYIPTEYETNVNAVMDRLKDAAYVGEDTPQNN